MTSELERVLNQGIHVLIFSGQYDIIVNHIGSDKALRGLSWNGAATWRAASQGVYMVDKSVAGYVKESENLASILILNSGHMVPLDLPHIALDMFTRFVNAATAIDSNKRVTYSAGQSKLSGSLQLPLSLECIKPGPTGREIPNERQHKKTRRGTKFQSQLDGSATTGGGGGDSLIQNKNIVDDDANSRGSADAYKVKNFKKKSKNNSLRSINPKQVGTTE